MIHAPTATSQPFSAIGYDLCSGWPLVRLGDVCERITDGTHQPPQFTDSGIPFIFVKHLVSGRIDFSNTKYISPDTYRLLTRRYKPKKGHVLYTAVGTFGIAVVVDSETEFAFQRHIAHIIPDERLVDSHFLAFYLNSPAGKRQSEANALGGAQRTVTLKSLSEFVVPLPPISEQKRIASLLAEQLAAVERARAAAEAQLQAARELPTAYLRAVFGGAAAQQWPTMRIHEIADTCSGSTPSRSRQDFYVGSIPWVKTGELRDNSILDTKEHISPSALEECSLRLLPEYTLLVAMYGQGQTRGRTGVILQPSTTNQACFAILPNPSVFDTFYLQYWFRYIYLALRAQSENRGGNQPNLNGDVLKDQQVRLPSVSDQKQMVSILNRQLLHVDQVCAGINARLAAVHALPTALLRRAFAGEI